MIWVGGPGAAERQWVALLFDGDLEIWLVGSHESRHAGQQVGASCPHVAEVLFAFDVPLPPVWSSLSKKISRTAIFFARRRMAFKKIHHCFPRVKCLTELLESCGKNRSLATLPPSTEIHTQLSIPQAMVSLPFFSNSHLLPPRNTAETVL